MAINKTLLRYDINTCFINFKEYFQLVFDLNTRVLKLWKSLDLGLYQEIETLEEKTNKSFKSLSSDVSWNISKHLPEANNLRFFLAVLISLKDLERYADYGLSISKIIFKHGKSLRYFFGDFMIFSSMLEYSENIWNLITESKGRLREEELEKGLEFKKRFRNIHHKSLLDIYTLAKNLILERTKNSEFTEEDYLIFASVNIVLTKIDRALDHVFNVLENFYEIQNPNKEIRQDL